MVDEGEILMSFLLHRPWGAGGVGVVVECQAQLHLPLHSLIPMLLLSGAALSPNSTQLFSLPSDCLSTQPPSGGWKEEQAINKTGPLLHSGAVFV